MCMCVRVCVCVCVWDRGRDTKVGGQKRALWALKLRIYYVTSPGSVRIV